MDDVQASFLMAVQLHQGPFDSKVLKMKADKIYDALQTKRSELKAADAQPPKVFARDPLEYFPSVKLVQEETK